MAPFYTVRMEPRHPPFRIPAAGAKRVGAARALSKLGFCSRSLAEEFIRSGRVTLNGATLRNPHALVRLGHDNLQIDSIRVQPAALVYIALHKPRGVVTTRSDEKGRPTVYDSLKSLPEARSAWLGPVGRLDQASEGLLLLTNDSEWGARITAPDTHLDKVYHVQIAAQATEALLSTLCAGVTSRGEKLAAKHAILLRSGARNSWLEITLDEGRNRHIRRMLDVLGIETLRIVRVSIGPLHLGELKKGEARSLAPSEKRGVDEALKRTSRETSRTRR